MSDKIMLYILKDRNGNRFYYTDYNRAKAELKREIDADDSVVIKTKEDNPHYEEWSLPNGMTFASLEENVLDMGK